MGATVSGSWSGDASGSSACVTASDGRCSTSLSGIHNRNKSVTFMVQAILHSDLAYDAAANTDPDGDSDGTSITVSQGDTDDGGDCVPRGKPGKNCE